MKRLALSFLSVAALLSADTLTLKNGSTINGRLLSSDGRTIRFAVGNEANIYDVIDIDSLRFTSPPLAFGYSQRAPLPRGDIRLLRGYQLAVRLIDPVDSKSDEPGRTYHASLEQAAVVNGAIVIPRGADAVAVLRDEEQSGKFTGKTSLTLALRSVSANGKTYDLATSSVTKTSGSRTTKSGQVIGGTAALGAIIGGLAGGGRGAGIGAASGAGLGTVAQVATSGQRVRVPSETVLVFTLANEVDLTSERQ